MGLESASIFIIILSSLFRKSGGQLKSTAEIEESLQCWLAFIVSNSKRAVQQCMLPSIAVFFTYFDKINQSSQKTVDSIQRLRVKFQGNFDLYSIVFIVDARSSVSVSKLAHHIRKKCKIILQRVRQLYQLCNDLTQVSSDRRTENYNKPATKWKRVWWAMPSKSPTFENSIKTLY